MEPIDELFERLDAWRHLPSYQLERRSDILFSLYLQEALEQELGFPVRQQLLPEFPVCRPENNLTYKVDYLARSEDGSTLIFVELKTDRGSRRDSQDTYLADASKTPARELLDRLAGVTKASKARGKYSHLVQHLEQMGLVRPTGQRPWEFEASVDELQSRVVYVQPQPDPDSLDLSAFGCPVHFISLSKFAEVVDSHDDRLSLRFATSLKEWDRLDAGSSLGI